MSNEILAQIEFAGMHCNLKIGTEAHFDVKIIEIKSEVKLKNSKLSTISIEFNDFNVDLAQKLRFSLLNNPNQHKPVAEFKLSLGMYLFLTVF